MNYYSVRKIDENYLSDPNDLYETKETIITTTTIIKIIKTITTIKTTDNLITDTTLTTSQSGVVLSKEFNSDTASLSTESQTVEETETFTEETTNQETKTHSGDSIISELSNESTSGPFKLTTIKEENFSPDYKVKTTTTIKESTSINEDITLRDTITTDILKKTTLISEIKEVLDELPHRTL